MKDNIAPPNLLTTLEQYDPDDIRYILRTVERYLVDLRSKGPVAVSDMLADSATVTGSISGGAEVTATTYAKVGSYTVAGVPSASTAGAGAIIYVSDETGGAVLAFSDGTDWRRVTDRAVIA